MSVIDVSHITKDYGNHKGVFDVSFQLEKGEVVGFLGPNGAGKTTTIRQLMGFIKSDQGRAQILNLDCFEQANQIQSHIGYLPGETAFMEDLSAMAFLKFLAQWKHVQDFSPTEKLIQELQLDTRGKIKKMSKGMKQKVAIVAAWMGDPDIFILDEPTSGLDPLMQKYFVALIQKAKEQGKTILMSSHIFEEIEHTCERVLIIKDGCIVADEQMQTLKDRCQNLYEIETLDEMSASSLAKLYPNCEQHQNHVLLRYQGSVDTLIKTLANYPIQNLKTRSQSLEEIFMQYYGGDQR